MAALDVNVYAYDLNTNTLITQLQVTALSYSERINDAGEFSFTLNLADPASLLINQAMLGYGGSPFKVIVDSFGSILYSGICWTTSYDSTSKQMTCTGKGIMSYFDQVVISRDYSSVTYPAGLTQASLVQMAINDVQADRIGANIGVQGVIQISGSTPQTTIIPGYALSQYSTVAQVLSDTTTAVTPGSGGVDFSILDSYSSGVPHHTCLIQSPRCGRPAGVTGVALDMSRAVQFSWPTDSMQSGNQIIAVGNGSGQQQLVSIVNSGIAIGGLGQPPLLQAVLSYNHVDSATQLTPLAQGAAQSIGQQSIATPVLTFTNDYPPATLGGFTIGDDALLHCPPSFDPRFWAGFDQFWRIVAYTVTINDAGVNTTEFTLNPPPIF